MANTVDLDEPIWGARNIGKVANRNARQTYMLLELGLLRAKKVGKTWVSSRRQIFKSLQGASVDADAP